MKKTRDLSLYDFLNQLQKEYLISEIRFKIYHRQKDKDFYKKLMSHKKDKIEDISNRNSLPNIFNSTSEKDRVISSITKGNYIDFGYKNENEKESYEDRDYFFYYSKGADFRIINDLEASEKVNVCTITSFFNISWVNSENIWKLVFNSDKEFVKVKVRGEQNPRSISTKFLKRIL